MSARGPRRRLVRVDGRDVHGGPAGSGPALAAVHGPPRSPAARPGELRWSLHLTAASSTRAGLAAALGRAARIARGAGGRIPCLTALVADRTLIGPQRFRPDAPAPDRSAGAPPGRGRASRHGPTPGGAP